MLHTIMPVAVYFQTWSSRWANVGAMMDLANVPEGTEIVYLSFCSPQCEYVKGAKKFNGTGLSFSMEFDVVRNAILILKSRKIKTLISVGGATYPFGKTFNNANAARIWDLCVDLGCDGIDIDWENSLGVLENQLFSNIIMFFNQVKPVDRKYYLAAACFSVGAYQPTAANHYCGMNILGLQQSGKYLDWINIMAYDANKEYDVQLAYDSYKLYYSGLIYIGLQVGTQGWGDALLQIDHVRKALSISKGYVFIWSLQKDSEKKTASVEDIYREAKSTLPVTIPPVVVPSPPSKVITSTQVNCPNCKTNINLELTYLPK